MLGNPICSLGAGILPGAVVASRAVGSDDLVLSVANTSDRVTLSDYFASSAHQVAENPLQ